MVLKINFFDKNDNLIKEVFPTEKDLYNKRFKRKNSILDIALNHGIDIKYYCMGGSCSACKCLLIEGDKFVNSQGLRSAVYKGIKEKEFLSCVATLENYENLEEDVEVNVKVLI